MTPASRHCAALLLACGASAAQPQSPRPAEPATVRAQAQVLVALPFGQEADAADFADARRGFIATLPDGEIKAADGRVVYTLRHHAFIDASTTAPDTVNPSLWRQARLNQLHGLFKVTERVYQVRSLDISNMTIVEGDTGLIVIDPLLSAETAKAALALFCAHRPCKPVKAVIYTHSHADHFGGVRGVTDEADVKAGKVAVLAPAGFMAHAVSENVIAGNAMSRRAQYQFGVFVPPGPRGQVDTGLGRQLSRGSITLIAPSEEIAQPLARRVVDGVEIEIQQTPGTEAPAEMNLYFPQFKLLNAAENVTHNLHNLYTLRGAEIRDGLGWAKYIEQLRLPDAIGQEWFARGYYGTLSHNAKAVYQKYLGWYDANPASLNPLPQAEAARRYVAYMGGADALLARALEDFKRGDYRWVAEVVMHAVWADSSNMAARGLAADAMEQMGYQAESGVWRNVYLSGANELRNGLPAGPMTSSGSADVVRAVPLDLFFDFLAVRLNPDKAAGKRLTVNWTFPDTNERATLALQNSVLRHTLGEHAAQADAAITLERKTLDEISLQHLSFARAVAAGQVRIEGNSAALAELLGLLDTFTPNFEIVLPLDAGSARR